MEDDREVTKLMLYEKVMYVRCGHHVLVMTCKRTLYELLSMHRLSL